eukprot:Hpha_TRINITY_DN19580_c0_g1::TRINITY_DN19580_c0_g1_i1::g.33555::m.33555
MEPDDFDEYEYLSRMERERADRLRVQDNVLDQLKGRMEDRDARLERLSNALGGDGNDDGTSPAGEALTALTKEQPSRTPTPAAVKDAVSSEAVPLASDDGSQVATTTVSYQSRRSREGSPYGQVHPAIVETLRDVLAAGGSDEDRAHRRAGNASYPSAGTRERDQRDEGQRGVGGGVGGVGGVGGGVGNRGSRGVGAGNRDRGLAPDVWEEYGDSVRTDDSMRRPPSVPRLKLEGHLDRRNEAGAVGVRWEGAEGEEVVKRRRRDIPMGQEERARRGKRGAEGWEVQGKAGEVQDQQVEGGSGESGGSLNPLKIVAVIAGGILVGGCTGWLIGYAIFGASVKGVAAKSVLSGTGSTVGGVPAPATVPVSAAAASATGAAGVAAASKGTAAMTAAKTSSIQQALPKALAAADAAAGSAALSTMGQASAAALSLPYITPAVAGYSGAGAGSILVGSAVGGTALAGGVALMHHRSQEHAAVTAPPSDAPPSDKTDTSSSGI